jgi:hypothetical protein
MNGLIITSAIFTLLTTLGHFAVGSKQFLKPMLDSKFDEVARKVMHCVFHYVSTFLILSTVALFMVGLGKIDSSSGSLLVQFIAFNFAIFAVWQMILALTSGITNSLFKMFQWVFFVLIAGFGFAGSGAF